jgi:hypothetical protein
MGEMKMHKNLIHKNLKGRDHFVDLGKVGRIILNVPIRNRDWIYLAQDREHSNMNLQVP